MVNTRVRPIVVLVFTAVLAAMTAAQATAQTSVNSTFQAPPVGTASKPYQALFGGTQRSDPGINQLALTLAVSEERGDL